jgi:hypothetical protein
MLYLVFLCLTTMPRSTGPQWSWNGPRDAQSHPGRRKSLLGPNGGPLVTLGTTNSMPSSSTRPAEPLPASLEYLISLNAEYQVLICPINECRKAVEPKAFSEHFFRIHKTKLELCRQVKAYIAGFPYQYTYKTMPLLVDRSMPQPILPVLEGVLCKYYIDRSRSRKFLREHSNKVHKL